MKQVLMAGSGQIALDIGIFLLKKGHDVTWLAGGSRRQDIFTGLAARYAERLLKSGYDIPSYRVLDRNDAPLPRNTGILIECTSENAAKKCAVIQDIIHKCETAVVLSASSSILPSRIHEKCIGCHFFRPVELSSYVEFVVPGNADHENIESARQFILSCGLKIIEQSESSAFAVNRLLLPLQAESFRLLHCGYDAREVDIAGSCSVFPKGQFSIIDSAGTDTVLASAENYVSRMPSVERADYSPLLRGLEAYVLLGRFGNKNRKGILNSEAVSFSVNDTENFAPENIKAAFLCLLTNTCRKAVFNGEFAEKDIDNVLDSVFFCDTGRDGIFAKTPPKELDERLKYLYARTGLSYFRPC